MMFLPIAAREMRVASRRWMTYLVRSGAALALMLLGTWFFLMMWREQPKEAGMIIFSVLSGATVLFAGLSGVRATSDCISQEKREGTLGLLFLTDLKGYDVVIGKLTASSINAFYAFLSALPVMAVPFLMGGVSLGAFGRMALVVLNTLFLSLALGIFVSCVFRDARNTAGMTFLSLVLLAGAFPALAGWLEYKGLLRPFNTALFLPSPGFAFAMSMDLYYGTRAVFYWLSVAVIHALAWLFLVAASLVVPSVWQDRPAGVERTKWRDRWRNWAFYSGEKQAEYRRELLNQNAFYWLSSRARLKPALVWCVLGMIALGWLLGLVKWRREWLSPELYVATGIVLNCLIKGWVAGETGRRIAEDRQSGALELMLSTPMTVADIVHGQWLTLRRQFLKPIVAIGVAWALLMFMGMREAGSADDRSLWLAFWFALMVMLVADLVTIFWVGLSQSLTARNPQQAGNGTVVRVLVLPWVGFALVVVLVALSATRGPGPSGGFFLGLWFMLGIAADLGFGADARNRVMTQFRTLAEQRYTPRPSFWRRLAGY